MSMQKTAIYYGFDDGQMLYALMSRASGIRVWIERLNGAFYVEWSMQVPDVPLAQDEFCAGTWGDHLGLMASAMLATGWFERTGREFAYPRTPIYNDGVGEIWKLTPMGIQWVVTQHEIGQTA